MIDTFSRSFYRRSMQVMAAVVAITATSAGEAQTFIPVPDPVYEAPRAVKSPQAKGSSTAKPQLADQGMIPCPSYGPGFFRQAGSTICLKVSGKVRAETGFIDRRSRFEPVTGSAVRADLGLETRTPTEYGTFRTVVVTRGLVSN
jgi:Porin subfamily